MQAKFIFSLILFVLVTIFAIQNSEAVPVKFITYHLEISQAIIILISVIIGATVAFLLGLLNQFKMNKTIKKKEKQIKKLEISVAKLEIENCEVHTKKDRSIDSETPD